MFRLSVSKVTVKLIERETVTTGSVNAYQVKFIFDSTWKDLNKTVVFKADKCGECYSLVLDDATICTIPWEVLRRGNQGKCLYIGILGTRGSEIVIPTIWCPAGYIENGTCGGSSTSVPTPDVYEQLLDTVEKYSKHPNLKERDHADSHPFTAISGIEEVTNSDILEMWRGG